MTVIIVILIVALLCAAVAGLSFYVSNLDTVYPKVSMDGVDVGGMSPYDAACALEDAGFRGDTDSSVTVLLPQGQTLVITAQEAGMSASASDAALKAYNYGREGGTFANTIAYLRCLISGMELSWGNGGLMDESLLRTRLEEAIRAANQAMMGSDFTITENTISLVKGAKAVQLDAEALLPMVVEAFRTNRTEPIEYGSEGLETDEIDLDALHRSVFAEVRDATYDGETGEIIPHIVGTDFDVKQAQVLWDAAANGDEVSIPLILTQPELTAQQLEEMLFRDVLSSKTTYLTPIPNRNNNVSLACKAIHELVLLPGEEFSYNGALGQRTTEKGYLGAGAYSGGEVVTEVGGGICQVSSTLYYCTLLANLEITDRTCHYFGVAYLPAGLDAAVSWKSPDFKFVNNREYPIKIMAYIDLEKLTHTIEILGTDVDGSYVQMTTNTWELEDGYGAVSYRNVYDKDGKLLSSTQESRSRYFYHEEEEESPSPSPSESPAPTESPTPTPSPEASVSPEVTDSAVSPTPELPTETPTPTEPVTPADPTPAPEATPAV